MRSSTNGEEKKNAEKQFDLTSMLDDNVTNWRYRMDDFFPTKIRSFIGSKKTFFLMLQNSRRDNELDRVVDIVRS